MKNNESKPRKKTNIFLWVLILLIVAIVSTAGYFIYRIVFNFNTDTEEGKQIRKEYSIDWSGRMKD
jgi:flagellar basal body-associated protein FliL